MKSAANPRRTQPETDLDALLMHSRGNDVNRGAPLFIVELADAGVPWDAITERLTTAGQLHGRVYVEPPWWLADREHAHEWALGEVERVQRTRPRTEDRSASDDGQRTEPPRAPDLAEFLAVEFPPRENIMDPVFPRQGLGMVHAWRGLGKTYFVSSFAYVSSTGGTFLKWRVERAWSVLYVDGEMRGVDMQQRLGELVRASDRQPAPGAFKIITPDLQPNGIPDLSTSEGQEWLSGVMEDRELIILDNLSSLVRSGTDKEDELWLPLQGWMQRQRAAGKSVLLVHHDGKAETQRGTSRREDILDTVFHLKKPGDYREQDGARFVLHFEKHRGFYGKDAEPFEVALTTNEQGLLEWTMTDLDDAITVQVAELLAAGCTVTQISKELGIGRATVDRHKKKAITGGLYHDN